MISKSTLRIKFLNERKGRPAPTITEASKISLDYPSIGGVNIQSTGNDPIEDLYRCIEFHFDTGKILALKNSTDEEFVTVGELKAPSIKLKELDKEASLKIIRFYDAGKGSWQYLWEGTDEIEEISAEGVDVLVQQQEQQPKPKELKPEEQQQLNKDILQEGQQEQQPKPKELKPEEQQQLNKDILQEGQQEQQQEQQMQQEVQEKSEDTYERDAITDDQGRKKYKTFYYENK
jgi:hypothetical protein